MVTVVYTEAFIMDTGADIGIHIISSLDEQIKPFVVIYSSLQNLYIFDATPY